MSSISDFSNLDVFLHETHRGEVGGCREGGRHYRGLRKIGASGVILGENCVRLSHAALNNLF